MFYALRVNEGVLQLEAQAEGGVVTAEMRKWADQVTAAVWQTLRHLKEADDFRAPNFLTVGTEDRPAAPAEGTQWQDDSTDPPTYRVWRKGEWRLDPMPYATAAERMRSYAGEEVAVDTGRVVWPTAPWRQRLREFAAGNLSGMTLTGQEASEILAALAPMMTPRSTPPGYEPSSVLHPPPAAPDPLALEAVAIAAYESSARAANGTLTPWMQLNAFRRGNWRAAVLRVALEGAGR